MTNIQHPITPPPELMQRWREQAPRYRDGGVGREYWLMARAAQWGADQELEACCDHIRNHQWGFIKRLNDDWIHRAVDLEQARRPKPPSLKEQALDVLNLMLMFLPPGDQREQGETIRRALERLQELEEGNE